MLTRVHSPAVNLLFALALALQCLLVQTHIEGLPSIGASVVAQHVNADTALRTRDGARAISGEAPAPPALCIICQEVARSGLSVLAFAPSLALAVRNFIAAEAIALSAAPRIFAAHNWQSRAPPFLS